MALRTLVLALACALVATVTFASGDSDQPAAAPEMEKEMVTDPTTGEMVTAPEYGGTLTIGKRLGIGSDTDPYFGWGGLHVPLVAEKLGIGDWGIDRDEWDFRSGPIPVSVFTGRLAERRDISPDGLTYTFHIRNGVLWHNKAPMNGRELTAHDIEFNFHRILGMGEFTEAGPSAFNAAGPLTSIPFESITATDDSTVVMKLNEIHLPALRLILEEYFTFIMPPEVIREHGDVKDWKNLVGTGPFELTALDEDSSFTLTKNPDYWGYDEKYPENRLPYVDEIRVLNFADHATIQAALITGKIDARPLGGGEMNSIDQADSLRETNPEIMQHTVPFRSNDAFAANVRVPPFDDIGVRKAMQIALDLETVANTYHKGQADPTPQGLVGVKGYFIPFDQWPEEVKQGYRYDPEGAEKLLDEAGYPRGADGTRFKTILNYGPWADLGYVEIAVSYWAEIGVDVEIDVLDYGEYHERLFSRTTLFVMSLIVFFSVRFIPGDAIDAMLGRTDFLVDVDREALARMLGLDVPAYVQYVRWIGGISLHGSLGRSLIGGRAAVEEKIFGRLPVTLQLGLMSIVIGLVIALPIGIYSAIRQDTAADYVGRSVAIIGLATPNFWLGTMVMIFPAIWWGWSPAIEVIRLTEDPLGSLGVFIIPSLILGTYLSAATMRITRTMMLEVLRQDYIRTAWAKGLKERVVVVRHAVKNALIPIVTLVGLQLPILVGGSVIMENIFNLPGLGRLMLTALTDRDYPVVSGVNLFFGTAVVGFNLLIDLVYGYLDPRVRYQ